MFKQMDALGSELEKVRIREEAVWKRDKIRNAQCGSMSKRLIQIEKLIGEESTDKTKLGQYVSQLKEDLAALQEQEVIPVGKLPPSGLPPSPMDQTQSTEVSDDSEQESDPSWTPSKTKSISNLSRLRKSSSHCIFSRWKPGSPPRVVVLRDVGIQTEPCPVIPPNINVIFVNQ